MVERARTTLPTVTDLTELHPGHTTGVRVPDGVYPGGAQSVEPLELDDLPPKLIVAFLAAEDEDFFRHDGYNIRSMVRALYKNARAGEAVQGASTITQQVAKHFLEPQRSWHRKLRELLLARDIEQRFTKREILDAYLGGVYFGENAWGVTQASYTYFGKCPTELTLPEMATLAGVLPAPSVFNPVANPDLALRERNRVLRRMHDIGVLDRQQYHRLLDEPLSTPLPPQTR